MTGTLFLCPTPIGNLEDMTPRALRMLREADIICAEDTRHSLKLLRHFEIAKPMLAYHEHNKYDKLPEILHHLQSGKKVCVVTDAGTPAISDPGEVLVRACIESGIRVEPLPGATALITALIASGMDTRAFVFEGFLPADKRARERVLARNAEETRTMIFYEAPHHLRSTLKLFVKHFGDRRITLGRELTKLHEEFQYMRLSEAVTYYDECEPRGEYVLVLEGADEEALLAERQADFKALPLEEHMERYLAQGLSEKDAMKRVAKDRGVSKRDIYAKWKKE